MSQMITIFILVLSLNSIESQELCSFLKPKGTYEGLGVYKSYTQTDSYYFYNRYGTEWKFNFDQNEVSMFANETQTFDPSTTNFGVKYDIIEGGPSKVLSYNCFIRLPVILNH